jgi:hypothetical protein
MHRPAAMMDEATKITLAQSTKIGCACAASAAKAILDTTKVIIAINTKVINLLIAHSLEFFIHEFRDLF